MLFAFHQHSACMHQHTVRATQFNTAAAQNTQVHFSWALTQKARAKLNWLQDLGSLQQRKYESQVNEIEKIQQRLVELAKQ